MIGVWGRFGRGLGYVRADCRLATKLDASTVPVMIAANAVCLTGIGVVVMLTCVEATSAAAEHAVNDHCQNCHHCCRPSRHRFKSHAIGKTSDFGIFVPPEARTQTVSRGIAGRVQDQFAGDKKLQKQTGFKILCYPIRVTHFTITSKDLSQHQVVRGLYVDLSYICQRHRCES